MPETRLPVEQEVANALDAMGGDGWTRIDAAGDAYAYVSASSFTITSPSNNDWSGWFKKGCRVRFVNTSVKYFVVTADSTYSAGVTTITGLNGGTDYSLANAAISSMHLSYATPPNFPDIFNFVPTWGSTGTAPALGNGTLNGLFIVTGRSVRFKFLLTMGSTTTYGTGDWTFTLPIAALNTNSIQSLGLTHIRDAGTANYERVASIIPSVSTSLLQNFTDPAAASNSSVINATTPFTWGNGDSMAVDIGYHY